MGVCESSSSSSYPAQSPPQHQNFPSESYSSSPVPGQPLAQPQYIPPESYSSSPVPGQPITQYPAEPPDFPSEPYNSAPLSGQPQGQMTQNPYQQPLQGQYPINQPHGAPVIPQYPPHYGASPHINNTPIISHPMNAMSPGIVSHRRGDALQPGSWIEILEPEVMVGLGWDFTGGEPFDLDASVTGFDYNYNVIESIYFNNKIGLNNSVFHYGDNLTGEGEGDDEIIKIILSKVPPSVHFLAVTINSYKGNSLIRARSAYIRLFTNTFSIGKYTLARTKDCIGLLLGIFERDINRNVWCFRVMADPIQGKTVNLSYDDIKTLLGGYTMRNLDMGHRLNHPLPGEPVIEFNKWVKLPNRFTYVGLGWNIQAGLNYDLDASILSFDRRNTLMDIIFHKTLQSYDGSIIHYGDNRTGLGEGDDEVLSIDFAKIDPNIFTMAVIINSFKENSLVNVFNAFIRLYDAQKPIGVHVFKDCPDCIGLCFGIFRKNIDGVWYFTAVREIVQGNESSKSVNDVLYILNSYPLKI